MIYNWTSDLTTFAVFPWLQDQNSDAKQPVIIFMMAAESSGDTIAIEGFQQSPWGKRPRNSLDNYGD